MPFRRTFLFTLAMLGGVGSIFAQPTNVMPAVSTGGVTLADCYQRAIHISETLGISEQNIRVVEEQYRNARGSILPHIAFIKQQFFQQNTQGSGGVSGSFLKSTQPESYFQLQQPLFSG